ncbi:MAG: DUF389 domain-containing protein [Phormidesmis sp.]
MASHPSIVSSDTVERVAELSELTGSYMTLMVTAGILSAVAMLTNSVPVLIGSMVIAPALSPLALISFAIVNRDLKMAIKGATSAGVGLGLAIAAAFIVTWILNITQAIPPETSLIEKTLLEERVTPGLYSVITAIAAGIAGIIALTERKTDTLVGVVAALALVPAGAAAAIAFLSRDPHRGWGGLALLGINIALIILSSVVTLLFLHPTEHPKEHPEEYPQEQNVENSGEIVAK